MLKKLLYFHLLPFAIACLIAGLFIFLLNKQQRGSITKEESSIIEGNQTALKGKFGNLLAGDSAELNFIASLQNKNQFTIFGSSEFTDSPVCPYHFFPDSMGIQMLGIGHAYHQSLSILIELLAADQYIDSTNKMCFIISPGWFSTAGTNTEAFVEFARPNFLNRILSNDFIPMEYKSVLGEYIEKNQHDFEALSPAMEQLVNQHKEFTSSGLLKLKQQATNYMQGVLRPDFSISNIEYNVNLSVLNQKKWSYSFDSIAFKIQNNFISSISNNTFYVYDDYYTKYLLKDGALFQPGPVVVFDSTNNIEYNQFKVLTKYLHAKKVNASFVILPQNPYCYTNLNENDAFFKTLEESILNSGFTCYNLYAPDTNSYDIGTLKDVMHLGDYGWMKVNKFIFETYYEAIQ